MYNIYLISTDTFEAVKLLRDNVPMSVSGEVEYREQLNYNIINFYVAGFEVGSPADLKAKSELEYETTK